MAGRQDRWVPVLPGPSALAPYQPPRCPVVPSAGPWRACPPPPAPGLRCSPALSSREPRTEGFSPRGTGAYPDTAAPASPPRASAGPPSALPSPPEARPFSAKPRPAHVLPLGLSGQTPQAHPGQTGNRGGAAREVPR